MVVRVVLPWAATITKITSSSGALTVFVSFSDGEQTVDETFTTRAPGPTWLDDAITSRLRQLDAISALVASTAITGVPYVPSPPVPSSEEQVQSDFTQAHMALQKQRELVASGIANASTLAPLVAAAKQAAIAAGVTV